MRVYGIDFTSSPSRRKPITCLACELNGHKLTVGTLHEWENFAGFEAALGQPGPWIAGIDFPFGQARRFIETIGWPADWAGYVTHAAGLGREGFVTALNNYKRHRAAGDKEHRRETDKRARSISPQKLFGVPVGKMFFEGAPRLLEAGVYVPGLVAGDKNRVVVEAYPGVLARSVLQRRSYKNDSKAKQTDEQFQARVELLQALVQGACYARFGIQLAAPASLARDPTGDTLDALLCAIQAAWAFTQRDAGFGMPQNTDPLEGWIADPMP